MALVKCPECGKENISDTAITCSNCGYGIKEHFKRAKINMKGLKRHITLFLIMLASFFILTSCASGSSSIVGTWTVDSYEIDGEVVSPETAVEWIGESFAANNDTKLVFQSSGHVKAKFPMSGLDDTLDYTVTDDLIEIYDDSHSEYLTLDGSKILIEISNNITMILKK